MTTFPGSLICSIAEVRDSDSKIKVKEGIRAALLARAAELEYPIEAVVEMAIASFLDSEALGFVDCEPGRGQ